MTNKNNRLVEQWASHVSARLKSRFKPEEVDDPLEYNPKQNFAETIDYMKRQIDEYVLDSKQSQTLPKPQTKEYSSKRQAEFENIVYLVDETEKLLFPDGEQYMSNLIFDEYNMDWGTKPLREILARYVVWLDTDKRY